MKPNYHSFLIRLWAPEIDAGQSWHITLESPESGEKNSFANLDELFDFFGTLVGAPSVPRRNTEGEINNNLG